MTNFLFFYFIIFVLNIILTMIYLKIAYKLNIYSLSSSRSLHNGKIPRGGGIIFASLFIFCSIIFFNFNLLNLEDILEISFGCFLSLLLGFFDDIYDIKSINKFIFQIIISLFFALINFYYNSFNFKLVFFVISFLIPLFFINFFNFIDGINGLAIGTSISSSITLVVLSNFTIIPDKFIQLILILLIVNIGFLFFNFPKAKLFMGDSGSIFLGYLHSTIFFIFLYKNYLTIWTLLIIYSFMLSDTLCTNIYRFFNVQKWYGTHRTHAYQYIAYKYNTHVKVTSLIMIFNFIYVLPVSILSILYPQFQIIHFLFVYIPTIFFSIKFGPKYQK